MKQRAAIRTLAARAADERDRTLRQPAHDVRTAAVLGIALGVCFVTCFLTGLVSHTLQQPPSWLDWSSRPAGLYRVTQGLHVISGTAAIPLLVAKLWSVYPRLFLPLRRDPAALVERVSLVPLVGGSIFMLFTGTANVARWYPWGFFFPRGHFWAAWITLGALVAHIGARQSGARASLHRSAAPVVDEHAAAVPPARSTSGGVGRRAVLGWAAATSTALVVVTAGQTVPFLRRAVLFAPRRPDIGSQGLPVNRSASEAGVVDDVQDASWRLTVESHGEERLALDLAALRSLPQRSAALPIACVEGWSASARWRGVPLRDLIAEAGITSYDTVEVVSSEAEGLYRRSTLNHGQADDRDTLLALELNGEALDLDHGFPVRLIGPNRPGVLQTKWVARVVVT